MKIASSDLSLGAAVVEIGDDSACMGGGGVVVPLRSILGVLLKFHKAVTRLMADIAQRAFTIVPILSLQQHRGISLHLDSARKKKPKPSPSPEHFRHPVTPGPVRCPPWKNATTQSLLAPILEPPEPQPQISSHAHNRGALATNGSRSVCVRFAFAQGLRMRPRLGRGAPFGCTS